MGDVCVQSVANRSALFWVLCSFCICVAFVYGCHAGRAYVSIGLMYYLYTRVMSYLNLPNVVLVYGRRTLRRVLALVFRLSVCWMNMFLLYGTPSVVTVLV